MMRPLQGCRWPPFEGYNRWPLWRVGRYGEIGVFYDNFFMKYKMFFPLLSSCLLCSIIMVIQSYIVYRDKIRKRLKNQFTRTKNIGTARQIFGTVPRLPVPGGSLPPSGRLPPPGDYLREVVSAPLKFWALVPHCIWDRYVYTSKIGSTVPKNRQHGAKNLACRADFFSACKWGLSYPLNQNANVTKRARFAAFAISIVLQFLLTAAV